LILLPASTSHPLSNQTPLILGHSSTDLQQELIMRIFAHGVIDKLDVTAPTFELFEQEHLMHIVAGQARRLGDQHTVKSSLPYLFT
jgi:hypothetical protein